MYNLRMDLGTKNANDLISKDFGIAGHAALNIINNKDIETFKKLCEQSDFLFDFIKEKMANNLINAVDENNYRNLFAFMKVYCADFEGFIVSGLVKFASEDLTDELLELFEKGTDEERTYCAAYFERVKDPLCIEYLNKHALSEFEPLAANCARALFAFDERELYDKMICMLEEDMGDLEKFEALSFLTSYGDTAAFLPMVEFMRKCSVPQNAALDLLSLKSFSKILEDNEEDIAIEIFDNIMGGYPEILPLSTLSDLEIFEFIKYLAAHKRNSLIDRIILKTKIKLDLISQNDIYTFDLDKNAKNLIGQIQNFLKELSADYASSLAQEILAGGRRASEALDVISELCLKEFASNIAEFAKTAPPLLLCECAKTLYTLDSLNLVNKAELVKNITDENILALMESYFI